MQAMREAAGDALRGLDSPGEGMDALLAGGRLGQGTSRDVMQQVAGVDEAPQGGEPGYGAAPRSPKADEIGQGMIVETKKALVPLQDDLDAASGKSRQSLRDRMLAQTQKALGALGGPGQSGI